MEIPDELWRRIHRTLQEAGMERTYLGERVGGVVAGCPRGPRPTPGQLAARFRLILAEIDRELSERSE